MNKCENCKYFHELKHNFRRSEGFRTSSCCIALTRCEGDVDSYDSFVVEVDKDDMCEMFTERE